jgi:hypothetical protein
MFSTTYSRAAGVRLTLVRGQVSGLLLLLMMGCGGERVAQRAETSTGGIARAPLAAPTAEEAKTLIANSAEFSEYQFTNAAYTLPLQRSAMNAPAREIAAKLRKARWISIDGSGRVVLTQKAEDDKRFLVRANGVVDIVPLARKELQDVVAVRTNAEGQPVVDFRWVWVPNEIGTLFDPRYSGEQHATATLYRLGDQWGVFRISPASVSTSGGTSTEMISQTTS